MRTMYNSSIQPWLDGTARPTAASKETAFLFPSHNLSLQLGENSKAESRTFVSQRCPQPERVQGSLVPVRLGPLGSTFETNLGDLVNMEEHACAPDRADCLCRYSGSKLFLGGLSWDTTEGEHLMQSPGLKQSSNFTNASIHWMQIN